MSINISKYVTLNFDLHQQENDVNWLVLLQ